MKKIISASILSADFARLGEETQQALKAGIDSIHFDVMDHHFVPNLSFGPLVCHALRKAGIQASIDVHLMVENPEYFIAPFAKAGANLLTFHPETVPHVEKTLQKIADAGLKTGLAFNPEHSVTIAPEIIQRVDLILLMSVNPGFSGQLFLESSLDKIAHMRHELDRLKATAMLGIDGGIKISNIGKAAKAGADFFVVGSGLFHTNNYQHTIAALRQELKTASKPNKQ